VPAWLSKFGRLLRKGEFRALGRRACWHLRWALRRRPWSIRTATGFPLLVCRTGSAALIYYQGASEPETTRFLLRFLAAGMHVVDVGAHFGEYTVLAARCIAPHGWVHAFEPQPELFALLKQNVALNGIRNSVLNRLAVADRSGEMVFWERFELASSSIGAKWLPGSDVRQSYVVGSTTLDDYCQSHQFRPNLVKVDAEGAELLVVNGASGLCSLPPHEAPVWLLEYSPTACARLGQQAELLPARLRAFGYQCFALDGDGRAQPFPEPIPPDVPTFNLVASKQGPL